MNVLYEEIINDDLLLSVFEITSQVIPSSLGLKHITLTHENVTIKFVIDLDHDNGTLITINNQRCMYSPDHTFYSMQELYLLIRAILEQYKLI